LIRFEGQLDADIRIATLPPGRDPDDILRETPDLWLKIIGEALPVTDFYLQVVSAQYDLTTAKGKSAIVREVLPLLREIGDPVERSHYVGQLARLVKIDERVLLAELDEVPRTQSPRRRPTSASQVAAQIASDDQKRAFGLEEYALAMILWQPHVLKAANDELVSLELSPLSVDDFRRTEHQLLFSLLSDWASGLNTGEAEGVSLIQYLADRCDPLLQSYLDYLRERWERLPAIPPEALGKDLVSRVLLMRDQHLQEKIAQLRFLQDEAGENLEEAQRLKELVNAAAGQAEQLRLIHDRFDRRSIMGRRRRYGVVAI
jgi:DNA primase